MTPWLLAVGTLVLVVALTDSPAGRGLRGALRTLEGLPRRLREHEARTKNRRSQGRHGVDARTNETPPGDGPVRDAGGGLIVSGGGRYGYGPRPLDDLLGRDAGEEEDDPVEEEFPARRVWVAQQLRAGARPTDIKRDGAQLYGVTTRTIDNDIAAVRRG